MSTPQRIDLIAVLNDHAFLQGIPLQTRGILVREIEKVFEPPPAPYVPRTVAEVIADLLQHDLSAPCFIGHWDDHHDEAFLSDAVPETVMIRKLDDGTYEKYGAKGTKVSAVIFE